MEETTLEPKVDKLEITEQTPILRVTPRHVNVLNFDQLLVEQGRDGRETYAFLIGKDLVLTGVHNDGEVTYRTGNREAVWQQMTARGGKAENRLFDRDGSIGDIDPAIEPSS